MYDELTAKDIQKMEEEIEYRKLVVRKQALEDVKEARAHGPPAEWDIQVFLFPRIHTGTPSPPEWPN